MNERGALWLRQPFARQDLLGDFPADRRDLGHRAIVRLDERAGLRGFVARSASGDDQKHHNSFHRSDVAHMSSRVKNATGLTASMSSSLRNGGLWDSVTAEKPAED
ncbi:MAG: hypothetical protein ACREBE_19775 [bacterium]